MDKVASAVQFRDYVLIFTENGNIYKIITDELTTEIKIILIGKIEFTNI